MRHRLFRGTLTLATFLAATCQVWCQSSGRLTGNVVDPQNNAVLGAVVVLMYLDGDEPIYHTTTGTAGDFSIPDIGPQTYKLRITHERFQTSEIQNLKISPGVPTVVNNLMLEAGNVPDVKRSENPESVQKADDQVNTTLTNDQLSWLPQLLRDPLQLINTQAGVSSNGSTFTTIDGLRPSYNNVTLDSVSIQDNYYRLKSLDYIPNRLFLDQVSEFTLVTSNSSTIYGNGAAQVAFATPSGTNTYHGALYAMDSPNSLNANEWFNNAYGLTGAKYRRTQGGAKLGGPIAKNKLFFYANYEFLRIRDSVPTQMTTPDADIRTGICPATFSGCGGSAGMSVLAGLPINSGIQSVLSALPMPANPGTTGFGTAQINEPDHENRDNVTLRADYQASARQTFAATYNWNREYVSNIDADSLNYLPIVPLLTNDNRNFLSLSWRFAINPNLTNELRGGFNRVPISFSRLGGLSPSLALIDLTQLQSDFNLTTPIGIPLLLGTEDKLYQPTASIDPLNNDWGDSRTSNTYNFQDNASWNKGRHNIQFGFQTQLIYDALSSNGAYSSTYKNYYGITPVDQFGASVTNLTGPASDLMGLLTGQISSILQNFNLASAGASSYSQAPSTRHYRYNNYAFYLQDNWKASKRLTISAGLRYELYPPVQETDGLALVPTLTSGSALATVLNLRANYAPASGDLYNFQHLSFAPSLGLAFDPTGTGRTVVRAGYSISYVNDDLIGAIDSSLSGNLGLLTTRICPSETLPQCGTFGQQTVIPAPSSPTPLGRCTSNFSLCNPSEQGLIGAMDPNLRVPYVQQWNIGVQQIVGGFLLDARYVGNHATGMVRAVNFNQINLGGSGFLSDFIAAGGGTTSACPTAGSGTNPFQVFCRLSSSTPTNDHYEFYQDISTGQAATAAAEFNSLGEPGYSNLYANSRAVNGATVLGNYSSSTYNALQLTARRLLRNGLQIQGSYTFSKVLSDSARTTDSAFEPYRDSAHPGLDRARAPFDLTHAIKGNLIYLLPFGKGLSGTARGLLDGWSLSGIVTIQSGNPFSILSGYGTVDTVTAALNTADAKVSGGALNQVFGVTEDKYNGLPAFIAPGDAAVDFANPTAGRLGFLQQREFSGPWVSDVDLGIQKTFWIKEHQSIEIRSEALNVLNHASWLIGDQNINLPEPLSVVEHGGPVRSGGANPYFGQINSTFYPSRKVQVSAYFRF